MKDDYNTNSHYLTYTFIFRTVGRMYSLNLGLRVKSRYFLRSERSSSSCFLHRAENFDSLEAFCASSYAHKISLTFVIFIVSGNDILVKLANNYVCKSAAITICWCSSICQYIQHKWIVLFARFDWFLNLGISSAIHVLAASGGKMAREVNFIRK